MSNIFTFLRRSNDYSNRPNTSNGRKHLTQCNSVSNQGPDLLSSLTNNTLIIRQEIYNDDLLRILSTDEINLMNQILLYSENGDLKRLQSLDLSQLSSDLLSCQGLSGYTPLHHACNRGHVLITNELLKYNNTNNINNKNDLGETPLHLAVYAGNILIVDQLLDYNADINAINNDGETCLFYATRKSQPAIVRLLLQRGIDPTIKDRYDEIAFDHCKDSHTTKAFQSNIIEQSSPLYYSDLLHIYSYLNITEILKCACVCSKWHRVSEYEEVWNRLGVRRWELALQSSLGFQPLATSSFYKPKYNNQKIKKKINKINDI